MRIDFAIVPAIRVQIDHRETGVRSEIALKFMRWVVDEEIDGFRGGSHGPEGYVGWFYPKEAEKIRAWLVENGCGEYDWRSDEALHS